MTVLVVTIFCVTYALIASRRLSLLPIGRPAGALLGAVLMVAVGALTPKQSYAAIDHDTIVLLFGMMLLTAYMDRSGLFVWLAARLLARCRTPWTLMVAISLAAGGLSAVLVNDTVCLFLTPVVVAACLRAELPLGPYLIALATSANIGSAATLVGNPQNMVIGSLSGISFSSFVARAGLASAVGLAINVALLGLYYRRALPAALAHPAEPPPQPDVGRSRIVAVVTLGVLAGFFAGLHLGYTTLAGACVLILAERREAHELFAKVDGGLLVFFAALFIVVHALERTGLVAHAWDAAAPGLQLGTAGGVAGFTALIAAGSNLVSNVPMVMLAGPHMDALGGGSDAWVLLAFVSTVAGNLTLVGSVANIIVAERARSVYALGFVEYLKFGAVSTLLVLAVGVAILSIG